MLQQAVQSGQHEAGKHHRSARTKRSEFRHSSASAASPRRLTSRPRRRDKVVRIHMASLAYAAEPCGYEVWRQYGICRAQKGGTAALEQQRGSS
jgi:hypothetical protein